MSWLRRLPLFVILMAIASLAMVVPSIHATAVDAHRVAQPFFYGAVLFGILSALLGLATLDYTPRNTARSHLLTLVAAFGLLPLMLAMPMREAIADTTLINAYFEMVSSLTTTGATVFDGADRLPETIHLWRALVGWLGGFLILLSAIAILAPLNLGGFEVLQPAIPAIDVGHATQSIDPGTRVLRFAQSLFPLYFGATMILWLALILSGMTPFEGICLAFSTMATSGITPGEGLQTNAVGWGAEALILVFLLLAMSRQILSRDGRGSFFGRMSHDKEIQIALVIIAAVTVALFVRHWIGALEVDEEGNLIAAARALWGSVFTTASFLTTTGFVSADWDTSQMWSGLSTPGLLLAGLAIFGGGVATTAGGVKLLRVYALYKHGLRELERLVRPSSIGSGGGMGRSLRREGAFVAWIFFMLFAISIAGVILALTLTGMDFDAAIIFAIAALSTTGPLITVTAENIGTYGDLGSAAKSILIAAMVLGRLETLAMIALFNPDFWRA
ncbi:TrkH family potassium uptake protein [Litoreibacter roseus]|uniref:Potassium transporter TrkH n=1 Tax=Litoreibacter roseus TaxID=2601869 RepID=A0A6N6JN27_9RHOB|nr:potassium transporter TrkG [Litoreibacter roseus]GFE66899.1 potassium transporter TrkH [Litoreibacter roseus]